MLLGRVIGRLYTYLAVFTLVAGMLVVDGRLHGPTTTTMRRELQTPNSSSIVFRDLLREAEDGSWGSPTMVNIPDWDHVAFNFFGSIYESHPGYVNGTYVSLDQIERRVITSVNGVQNVHTLRTFIHNSRNATTSVLRYQQFPLVDAVATVLYNQIRTKVGSSSRFLAFNTTRDLINQLAPAAQKGGNNNNNSFTSCGLLEWAAETSTLNGGQGYIPNYLEQIVTSNGTFPLLSPALLLYAMGNPDIVWNATQFIKGFFDSVDYVITDPLGRRTGRDNTTTEFNEIPTTFVSLPGDISYLVIANPLPGPYIVTTYSRTGKVGTAVLEASGQSPVTVTTSGNNSIQEHLVALPTIRGSRGDVNGDGVINVTDLDFLEQRIPRSVTGFITSGDINGDGVWDLSDVELLRRRAYNPSTASIVFRELRADANDGSWGSSNLNIPGLDHVALSFYGSIYESHPGYRNGIYVSKDLEFDKVVSNFSGVQNEQTYATFQHDSGNASTAVIDFQEIKINDADAFAIYQLVRSKVRQDGFLRFTSIDGFIATNGPNQQKGQNGTYSGCGLIEWAAEQVGINRGDGFFPNRLESIITPNQTFPFLSPNLLYYTMQNQDLVFNATQTIKGYFDPVNYLVTDPLGRRTGIVNVTRYNEIPTTNFNKESTASDLEHLLVFNPIPGEYKMKVSGIPGSKGVAVLEVAGRPATTVRTAGDASIQETSVVVPVVSGSRGDVNGDGSINQADLTLLKQKIPAVVGGFANTGDMNGDGQLGQVDVDLLTQYLNLLAPPTRSPVRSPTRVPTRSPTLSPKAPPLPAQATPPTRSPVRSPTRVPTRSPTKTPSLSPKAPPLPAQATPPTRSPVRSPTRVPTRSPTKSPSLSPKAPPLPAQPNPLTPTLSPKIPPLPAQPNPPTPIQAPARGVPTPAPVKRPSTDSATLSPMQKTPPTTGGLTPAPVPRPPPIQPDIPPTTPTATSRRCQAVDRCGNGFLLQRYTMHRTQGSRCVERCMLRRIFTSLILPGTNWKCGKCGA